MTEPGARQDERNMRVWMDVVRAKHRIRRPVKWSAMHCICGWQAHAPQDCGIVRQRDFLLDAYNDHLGVMRRQRRAYLEKRKTQKAAAKTGNT